jgi:hypothetical protein
MSFWSAYGGQGTYGYVALSAFMHKDPLLVSYARMRLRPSGPSSPIFTLKES